MNARLSREAFLWFEWLKRTLIVGGLIFFGMFFWVQIMGAEIMINLPTIEKTFAKK
jgi:hypothetical protein